MAAGDQVPFQCRYAKHPTDEIDGVRFARITVSGTTGENPGPAKQAGGPASQLVQKQRINVEIFGTNPNALRALVAAAAANLVIGYKGVDGANEKHTLKNMYFSAFVGALEVRDPDTGGPIPMYGISGTLNWGADDTLALMWVSAAEV